jgi:predicted esterase
MPAQRCPTHGLFFDPTVSTGCARCVEQSTGRSTPSRRALLLAAGGLAAIGGAGEIVRRVYRATPRSAASCSGRELSSDVSDIDYDVQRKGAVFEPPGVTTSTPCPVILLFDPAGLARCIVERYSDAARARGWIAASSYGVADGTSDEADTERMMALLEFVRSRRKVDDRRIFAGGFSGGGCGAYRLAIVKSEILRGAIVECGHMAPWRSVGDLASPSLKFYLFTREQDFNRPATRQLQTAMEGRRCRVVEVEKPGGHAPMTPDEIGAALEWLESG